MTPNLEKIDTLLLNEEVSDKSEVPKAGPREFKIVYANVLLFLYFYIAGLYGLYLCFTSAKWQTILFSYLLFVAAEIGITAGAHRLWSHKSYKAKLPLEIILMVFNTLAFQNTAFDWVRDHRLHHKYSDTDADPHNASRGFFYSHVGWLLVRKHEEVKKRGQTTDLSDVYSNPVLMFQKNYAVPFIGAVCFVLPTLIPMYFWGETFINAWHITMLRYILNLNVTWLVNSAAHLWGNKPYDQSILPRQNLGVAFATFGEGFHNYHHTFPWDYRTGELGNNKLNFTTLFIDFFAALGWAYDLKTVPEEMIRQRAERTGDKTNSWGWGDKDLPSEHKKGAKILYAKSELRQGKVDLAAYTGHPAKLGELYYHVFIVRLTNKGLRLYQAFCSGNIITTERVLTSAHCFLTNRKRFLNQLLDSKVVSGALSSTVQMSKNESSQQWRGIKKIYSQSHFRFPAYALAVLVVDKPFEFNEFVKSIPFASKNFDYDGICVTSVVRPVASWATSSSLFFERSVMVTRPDCELTLLRSCRLYYCTDYIPQMARVSLETEGAGLVCYQTGDPEEKEDGGVLVGVTVLLNIQLPTLHHRIAKFRKWVIDGSAAVGSSKMLVAMLLFLVIVK